MLCYHHKEFITKKIFVLKTYHRKNMKPLSTSVTTIKADKGNTVVTTDQANYVKEMEKNIVRY